MKLYFAPTSPFVRKTMIVIEECGLTDQVEIVDTKVAPGSPNMDYTKSVNPTRNIPALETDNGDILMDSLVICDYVIGTSGNQSLLPADQNKRTQVLRNHSVINSVTERAVALRYETAVRPEEHRWPAMIDDNKDRVISGLAWLNERADQFEGDFTLASAALVSLLRYLDIRFDDWGWRTMAPNLAALLETLNERDSVKAVYAE